MCLLFHSLLHMSQTIEIMSLYVKSSGELLKSMVFGAMDGIVTTFAIVCAAAGAEQSDSVIVTMVHHLIKLFFPPRVTSLSIGRSQPRCRLY